MNGDIFDSNELDLVKDVVRKCTNVCILVDYDNLYHSMKKYGINVSSDEYNFISHSSIQSTSSIA